MYPLASTGALSASNVESLEREKLQTHGSSFFTASRRAWGTLRLSPPWVEVLGWDPHCAGHVEKFQSFGPRA